MQVILLEKVGKLGVIGETVDVRPGFAKNFLFPTNKALRATDKNIALFSEKEKEIRESYQGDKENSIIDSDKLFGKKIFIQRQS